MGFARNMVLLSIPWLMASFAEPPQRLVRKNPVTVSKSTPATDTFLKGGFGRIGPCAAFEVGDSALVTSSACAEKSPSTSYQSNSGYHSDTKLMIVTHGLTFYRLASQPLRRGFLSPLKGAWIVMLSEKGLVVEPIASFRLNGTLLRYAPGTITPPIGSVIVVSGKVVAVHTGSDSLGAKALMLPEAVLFEGKPKS